MYLRVSNAFAAEAITYCANDSNFIPDSKCRRLVARLISFVNILSKPTRKFYIILAALSVIPDTESLKSRDVTFVKSKVSK